MSVKHKKIHKIFFLLFLIFLLFGFNNLHAQGLNNTNLNKEKEPVAIMELGITPSWDLIRPNCLIGPTIGIEFTPVKEKLEIEIGASQYYNGPNYNWQFDLLFKKPYEISKKIEVMVGAGPQWSFSGNNHSLSAEIAVDLMYWPFKKTIGFYLEPNYDYEFQKQNEQSIGFSTGLIIAIH